MAPQSLRFSTDIKRLVVIDRELGSEYVCKTAIEMMLLRGQLERAHMTIAETSPRKACRLRQIAERQEAGQ